MSQLNLSFRIRVLQLTCRSLGILFLLGTLGRNIMVELPTPLIIFATGTGSIFLSIDLALRLRPQWFKPLSWFFCIIFLLNVSIIALKGIGFAAPILGLLSISPVFAGLLLGQRGCISVSIGAFISLLLIYWVDSSGIITMIPINMEELYKAKFVVMPIILISSLALSLAYEASREKKEGILEKAILEKQSVLASKEEKEFLLNQTGILANIGGWSYDISSERIWWSDQTHIIYGIPIGTNVTLETMTQFHPIESKSRFEKALKRAIHSHDGWDLEIPFINAKGKSIWLKSVGESYTNDQNMKSIRGTFQDITKRIRDDESLKEAHDSALQAASAKSLFLANMSHEIRTPMNGVLGNAELLHEEELSPRQETYVRTILDSGRAMLQILNDILDFSKIDAGKLTIESHNFNLREQLTSVYQLYESAALDKGIKLELNLTSNIPDWIYSDSTRIRQILSNLISNGIKFTENGSVAISVHPIKQSSNESQLRFEVTDTGIGIDKSLQDKLFNEFSQVDLSTTRKFGGTGLGLAICQRLATLLGSKIFVKSAPEVGSVFYFDLLVHHGKPIVEQKHKKRPQTSEVFVEGRALLVEDNPINRDLALNFLSRFGIQADIAVNGKEAIEQAQKGSYKLIFMDCQMPVMDGYTATRTIRSLNLASQPIIIAMTANAMADDREKCLDAGMDDYISKPISRKALSSCLKKWF